MRAHGQGFEYFFNFFFLSLQTKLYPRLVRKRCTIIAETFVDYRRGTYIHPLQKIPTIWSIRRHFLSSVEQRFVKTLCTQSIPRVPPIYGHFIRRLRNS